MPETIGPPPLESPPRDLPEYVALNDPEYTVEHGSTLPAFSKRLSQVVAKVGDTAEFSCNLTGKPSPSVTWCKDTAIIEDGDGITRNKDGCECSLVIENVEALDSGLYEVRGENANGAVTCAAELIVLDQNGEVATVPPSPLYSQEMESCVTLEGKTARFNCQVTASPNPEIIWLKDGRKLEHGTKFNLLKDDEMSQTLVIHDVCVEDAGRYVCWARNEHGEAFSEGYLHIISKADTSIDSERHTPAFKKYLHDLIVVEGKPAEFRFKYEAKPDAIIQFFINRKDLTENRYELTKDEDQSCTLRIPETRLEDAGKLTCKITNPLGFDTCSAELMIIEDFTKPKVLPPEAPRFITRFNDVDVNVGFEARFKCKVIGQPMPTVTWYKDDQPISPSDKRYKIEDYGEIFILIIEDCKEEDGGEFCCRAENTVGAEECRAKLNVTMSDVPLKRRADGEMVAMFGYAPVFTTLIQDCATKQFGPAKFTCRAYGMPDPEITWMKDGNAIPEEDIRYERSLDDNNNYTLYISESQPNDSGLYTCQLKNFAGKASCTAKLEVKPEPFYDKMKESRPSLDLIEPDIIRRKRSLPGTGVPFSPAKKQSYDLKTASVPEVGYPSIPSQKPCIFDKEPTSVRLSWLPGSAPYIGLSPLTYTIEQRELPQSYWMPVAENVYGNVYVLYDLNPNKEYMFRVKAKNEHGASNPTDAAYLEKRQVVKDDKPYLSPTKHVEPHVFEHPVSLVPILPSDKPTFLDIRESTCRLNWLPAYIPSTSPDYSPVLYDVEMSTNTEPQWRTVAPDIQGTSWFLTNLDPDKQYSYRIRAHNKHGESGPTSVATMDKWPTEAPSFDVKKPTVSDIGPDSFQLSWSRVTLDYAPPLTYHLEAQQVPSNEWRTFAKVGPDTSFRVTDLVPDQDYRFRLRALDDLGRSKLTDPLYFPRAKSYPEVPITRPELTELEPYSARLKWNIIDIPDHEGAGEPLRYLIEVQDEPGLGWRSLADDVSDTEYYISDIEPMRDYGYRVRRRGLDDYISPPSPPVSLYRTLAKSRRPVTEVYMVDVDEDSIGLHWNRVYVPPYDVDEEPLLYLLEFQEPGAEWQPLVSGIPTTSYRVSGLDPHRDYMFRVRSESEYGVSPPSAPLPYYRQPSEVPSFITMRPELQATLRQPPSLSWQAPTLPRHTSKTRSLSPPSYTVQYRELPDHTWKPLATGLQDTRYTMHHGIHPRRDYDFRVILDSPSYGTPLTYSSPHTSLHRLPVLPSPPKFRPTITENDLPDSLLLSWKPAYIPNVSLHEPIHYRIEYLTNPELGWRTLIPRAPGTSFRITDLDLYEPYQFRVKPVLDEYVGAASEPVMLFRKPVPILPMNEPLISDIYPDSIRLTWRIAEPPTNSADITRIRYVIESQSPIGSPWVPAVTDIIDSNSRIPNLNPSYDYLFRVKAVSPHGESEPTLPVFLHKRHVHPRIPDREPYLSEITPTSVKITWSPIRTTPLSSHIDPVTYLIEIKEVPSMLWKSILRNIPSTSTTITGLQPDKEYLLRVRAENDFGMSDPTRHVTLPKRAALPKMQKTEPLISDVRPGCFLLSWRPADIPNPFRDVIPVTYDIEVRELPTGSWTPMYRRIPQTSFHVSGLIPGSNYDIRVRPRTDYGQGEPTPSVLFRHPTEKSFTLSPELWNVDHDSVSLKWKIQQMPAHLVGKLPDTDKFMVESLEWPHGDWRVLARDISGPTYKVNQLNNKKDYLFRVRPQHGLPKSHVSDSIISYFPRRYRPSVPITRPDIYDVEDNSVRLSWQPYKHQPLYKSSQDKPYSYSVEMRPRDSYDWLPITSHYPDTVYQVRGLQPYQDYEFRVRPEVDHRPLEPTRPVSLYRRYALPPSPLGRPVIDDEDDTSVRLRWNRVHVPSFDAEDDNLTFLIEKQSLPTSKWETLASGVPYYEYHIHGLDPWKDYKFRVRSETPDYGITSPSPSVSLYRRPLISGVPITDPVIDDVQPTSVRLRWQTAYVPPYRHNEPITFNVEGRATNEREWRSLATNIPRTEYNISDLDPLRDYYFRLRAVSAEREISRPTPVIPVYRSHDHGGRLAIEDTYLPRRPYIDMLTVKVPPNLPAEQPKLSDITDTSATISWRSAKVPPNTTLVYHVEQRCLPHLDWVRIGDSLPQTTFYITDLSPNHNYWFRVKAESEYGYSRPTLPAKLSRKGVDYLSFDRDDSPEINLSAPSVVKPRLPLDAPVLHVEASPPALYLTWLPARIPAYGLQKPLFYVVDMSQPPDCTWHPVAEDIQDCRYRLVNLDLDQPYNFSIRARCEDMYSDPTLVVAYTPPSKRTTPDDIQPKSTEPIKVPVFTPTPRDVPRPPVGRPVIRDIEFDSLTLTWTPGRQPSYLKDTPVTFTVQQRRHADPWITLVEGLVRPSYVVSGLNPEDKYSYRVKAVNLVGESEPSLPVSVQPNKQGDRVSSEQSLVVGTPCDTPLRDPSIDTVRGHGLKKSKTDPGPVLQTPSLTQYAWLGDDGVITIQVRAVPMPIIYWFRGDEKIEDSNRVQSSSSAGGDLSLVIRNMTPEDVGDYKCYAENEHGRDSLIVRLELGDPPVIIDPLFNVTTASMLPIDLHCLVDGRPRPTVSWTKDGSVLTDTPHLIITNAEQDLYSVGIKEALPSDGGVYTCTAVNQLGHASSTCHVTIDDNYKPEIYLKDDNINKYYYIMEEIGRGRSCIVYRAIEKSTGHVYAAKFLPIGSSPDRDLTRQHFEILKMLDHPYLPKIHEAFETNNEIVFVTRLVTGPNVLTKALKNRDWSESHVASIISHLLPLVAYLHENLIVACDIKPTDIIVDPASNVHLVDLGCAKRLYASRDIKGDSGSPEFSAPEIYTDHPLSPACDVWSIGALTYLLLTGKSPFYSTDNLQDVAETLSTSPWSTDPTYNELSADAKDFIAKLLVKDPSERPIVSACMEHEWFKQQVSSPLSSQQSLEQTTKRLTSQTVPRQSIGPSQCLIHPIQLEDPHPIQAVVDPVSGAITYPESSTFGNFIDTEPWTEWKARNLSRQDSQLSKPLPSLESEWLSTDPAKRDGLGKKWPTPRYSSTSTVDDSEGSIVFSMQPRDIYFIPGDKLTISCSVLSETTPSVKWYKDGKQISTNDRFTLSLAEAGFATLLINKADPTDAGIYKCTATNISDQVSCYLTAFIAGPPSIPTRPAAAYLTDTSAVVLWEAPATPCPYPIIYRVDYLKKDAEGWKHGVYTGCEFARITNLQPQGEYRFRVCALNKHGAGPYSYSSSVVLVSADEHHMPSLLGDLIGRYQSDTPIDLDDTELFTSEQQSLFLDEIEDDDPAEYYDIEPQPKRGGVFDISRVTDKSTGTTHLAKSLTWTDASDSPLLNEITQLSALRHYHIGTFLDAFSFNSTLFVVYHEFIQETVVEWITRKVTYTEKTVTDIVRQILQAFVYLHYKYTAYLNLNPSTVKVTNHGVVKLVDFHLSRPITDGEVVPLVGCPDFLAPEIVCNESAGAPADIWSLGSFVFLLLSGVSPFLGINDNETLANIAYLRYSTCRLYPHISTDGLQFLHQTIKRMPQNRLSAVACSEHPWLNKNQTNMVEQASHVYSTKDLRYYIDNLRLPSYYQRVS